MFLSKITTHSWQYHRTTEHEESTSTRTTGRLLLLIVPHDEDLGERGRQRHLLDDLVQTVEPVVREDDGREALHPGGGVRHRQRVARRHLAAEIDTVSSERRHESRSAARVSGELLWETPSGFTYPLSVSLHLPYNQFQ